ncbi:hypothetical protein MKW92_025678, partial [Papaver armeniacum]
MNAVKGWDTNEKGLFEVLAHRNAAQRQAIRHAYQEHYHEDLIKRLESELSGHLEKAMYRWLLEPLDCDAVLANVALKKHSLDYPVIIEKTLRTAIASTFKYNGYEIDAHLAKAESHITQC